MIKATVAGIVQENEGLQQIYQATFKTSTMSVLYGECRRRIFILFQHVAAISDQRSLRLLSSQELNLAKDAEM